MIEDGGIDGLWGGRGGQGDLAEELSLDEVGTGVARLAAGVLDLVGGAARGTGPFAEGDGRVGRGVLAAGVAWDARRAPSEGVIKSLLVELVLEGQRPPVEDAHGRDAIVVSDGGGGRYRLEEDGLLLVRGVDVGQVDGNAGR